MTTTKKHDSRLAFAVVGVAILCIVAAFITALALTDSITAESTPLISAFLGLVGILLPAIVAMLRSVENREMTREIDRKVNGHISRLTEAAINAGVKPEDLPPLPPSIETPIEEK